MSRTQTSFCKVSRTAIVLIAALAITTISSGGQHWGLYVQGHTPAYVPHNPEHGFNQTRWRRWPEAWPSDLTVSDAPKPAPAKPTPAKEEDDDQPPAPPSTQEQFPDSGLTPEFEQPKNDLQPVPPDDGRPAPPPGLTRPEGTEPTEPPTDAVPGATPGEGATDETFPPATTEEQTPELAPLEEEPTEPIAPPATGPSRTPGTPLPVPSTDLDTKSKLPRTSPPLKRRGNQPLQARSDGHGPRQPRTSEAVFREEGPTARVTSRPEESLDAQFEKLPSSLEALPEEPPAKLGEPELFQPGATNRAAPAARPSSVKPASFNAPSRIALPESRAVIRDAAVREVTRQQTEVRQVRPPVAEVRQKRAPQAAPQRANPLRDDTAGDRFADGGLSRENPLRR